MINQLSLAELQALIASMYSSEELSTIEPQTIMNATARVLNKIGLMVTIKGDYVDRLPEMDGPELPLGKTIEEYFMQLPKILDEDRDGSEDGTPEDPHFLPAYYSYSLDKKRIKITRRWDEYEEACYKEEQFLAFIAEIEMALNNSHTVYKYGLKRQLLGKGIALIDSIFATSAGSQAADGQTVKAYVAATAASLEIGDYVISPSDSTVRGIVTVPKGTIANNTAWATAVAAGYVTVFDLYASIAKPTDAESGEAFIEQVLNDLEIARDNSEGHSLNGATIGATDNLKLYVPFGLNSVLAVKVKAGAFHREELNLSADVKALPDYGAYSGDVWGVLCDSRMFVLFLGYQNTRVRENADGDFINYVRHVRYTPFMSRATFIRLYVQPAAAAGAGD